MSLYMWTNSWWNVLGQWRGWPYVARLARRGLASLISLKKNDQVVESNQICHIIIWADGDLNKVNKFTAKRTWNSFLVQNFFVLFGTTLNFVILHTCTRARLDTLTHTKMQKDPNSRVTMPFWQTWMLRLVAKTAVCRINALTYWLSSSVSPLFHFSPWNASISPSRSSQDLRASTRKVLFLWSRPKYNSYWFCVAPFHTTIFKRLPGFDNKSTCVQSFFNQWTKRS